MRMLPKLTTYILAYFERLQGKCSTAVRSNPGARRENLIWCHMRTQNLLNVTRWWITSVYISESGHLQWAEEARRVRDPASNPHAETLRRHSLDNGILADEVLPKDLEK